MNNRVLLVVAGLAIPLVALVVFTQTADHRPKNDATKPAAMSRHQPRQAQANKPAAPQTLDEAKAHTRARITMLNNMTPQEFENRQKRNMANDPNHVMMTLAEAKTRANDRLKKLEAMTPEQFAQQQAEKKAKAGNAPAAAPAAGTAAPAAQR